MLQRPIEPGQYTSIRFTERLAEAGIQPSVAAVGSSYDNALAETINGLYKTLSVGDQSPAEISHQKVSGLTGAIQVEADEIIGVFQTKAHRKRCMHGAPRG